jgi:DNA-binding LacI/PurR family transcriptional regulator
MALHINAAQGLAERTARRIAAEIARQELAPGARIQPLRELAGTYGVSYVTAQRAVKVLQEQGLLEAHPGDGIYVKKGGLGAVAEIKPGQPPVTKRVAIVQPYWIQSFGAMAIHRIIKAFMEQSDAHGWPVELIYGSEDDARRPEFVDKFIQRGIDGVVWLRPVGLHRMNLMRLVDRGVSVVLCGRRFPELPIPAVAEDYGDIARKTLAWCREQGIVQPALLLGMLSGDGIDPYSRDLLAAYREAAKEPGYSFPSGSICQAQGVPRALHILERFVHENPDADAFVCPFSSLLKNLRDMVFAGHWKDPSRIAVIDLMYEYEQDELHDLGGMRLLKVLNPFEAMGEALCRVLASEWTEAPENEPIDLSVRIEERSA